MRDSLQNIIGIIDSTGDLVVKYNYKAYGQCTVTLNSEGLAEINPFRYKGYYYDQESGMYYCNSRYYVPEWCRWLTPDSPRFLQPVSFNGMNLFAYCYNSPVNYMDDMGNLPKLVEIISTLVGYGADLYSFVLRLSLKNMPELTMQAAKKIARKAGHVQSARSYIRSHQAMVAKTQKLSQGAKKISKYLGRAMLAVDALWSVGENYLSGDPNWVSDTVVDVGLSVGIYALGCIPYVGWALAIGGTITTEVLDEEIEDFKDWFANEWNDFWSFSWAK